MSCGCAGVGIVNGVVEVPLAEANFRIVLKWARTTDAPPSSGEAR